MQMLTAKEKAELCGVESWLDNFSEEFDYNLFYKNTIIPYCKELPYLAQYKNILFEYGVHLVEILEGRKKDDEDKSFVYCMSLLQDYKLLLEGNIPNISITKSKKIKRINIDGENYRRILMMGLEQEMRKYNLHHKMITQEEAFLEIKAKNRTKWVTNYIDNISKHFPKLPEEVKYISMINAYRLEFPHEIEEFTLEYITEKIEVGNQVNAEKYYIKGKGAPIKDFEHDCVQRLWLLLNIDERINNMNTTIISGKQAFIYDFLSFFKLHSETIVPGYTTNSKTKDINTMMKRYNNSKTINKAAINHLKKSIESYLKTLS